ncbi:PAS domain S-box protein [Leptospira inadai serovar Lyme str. 10]|uniref:histidine kinase n=2 Tax=Leptospira inadai serovar Lyme TaxID=293084 RepID=V6HXL8_9LEPT|nr:PAS domain-containing sensor histidine kinase [Leptospira inadai]EQA37754.1 PAS domain S-box protein [Leptospira inadai serovar Lyme str. 10]PNV75668.1 PAS domain-containing sensor histidine kinase [Leptospira inadai serovar Lyme]
MKEKFDLLESPYKPPDDLFDDLPIASLLIDQTGLIRLANHQFELLSGCKKKEVENHFHWMEFVRPDDRESLMERFINLPKKEKSNSFKLRTRLKTADDYRTVYVYAKDLRDAHGKGEILVQLQEFDEVGLLGDYDLPDPDCRWKSILVEGMDSIAVLDLSGNILFLSKTITGISVETYIGKSIYDLFSPHESHKLKILMSQVLKSRKPNSWELWSDFTGKRRHYFVRISPVSKQGEVQAIVALITDTTEQKESDSDRLKRMESERHRQKLESLGTLAAGVAHEINNPLTGILNYAEIVRDQLGMNEPLRKNLDVIIRESERISGIVRSLLGFVHKEEWEKFHVKAGDSLYCSVQLLLPFLLKDGIAVENLSGLIDAQSEIPYVFAEPQRLKQVFLNLITNARDSLNEKYPSADTRKKLLFSQSIIIRDGVRFVKITLEDTGTGIKKENLTRIFDPFFTTKPTSVGTGLGLSISYDIVKDLGGEIEFETEDGEYARFHVILPVAEKIS